MMSESSNLLKDNEFSLRRWRENSFNGSIFCADIRSRVRVSDYQGALMRSEVAAPVIIHSLCRVKNCVRNGSEIWRIGMAYALKAQASLSRRMKVA